MRKQRSGLMLIEAIVVTLLVGLILHFGTLLALALLGQERSVREDQTETARLQRLADRFRQDVATAEAAPARWQSFTADEHCLVLKQSETEYVLYHWYAQDEPPSLVRKQVKGEQVQSESLALSPNDWEVQFVLPSETNRLAGLHLTELRQPKRRVEVVASLGGGR